MLGVVLEMARAVPNWMHKLSTVATWHLDPETIHLNHGSFGACPDEVLDVQTGWRSAMEANPVAFMLETYQPALDEARSQLGKFVNADAENLVFVPNATYGVNSVLRSLEGLIADDGEIVVTNHGYNACNNAVAVSAAKANARVVCADVPFPVHDPVEISSAVFDAITDRTALVVVDHVSSPTGIVFPIDDIVRELEPAIPVLVDGAHAPGMVDVDLTALGASFYTANCHKWMCAPKGSGFLYVARPFHELTQAVAIGHGHNAGWPASSRFQAQFDWTGTDDPTARLSVGAAIETMSSHRADGWEGIKTSNRNLALRGRAIIADALGVDTPVSDGLVGSIASLQLPAGSDSADNIFDPLMISLRRKWGIEVPVFAWHGEGSRQRLVRISAQQYNNLSDYEYLSEALVAELNL